MVRIKMRRTRGVWFELRKTKIGSSDNDSRMESVLTFVVCRFLDPGITLLQEGGGCRVGMSRWDMKQLNWFSLLGTQDGLYNNIYDTYEYIVILCEIGLWFRVFLSYKTSQSCQTQQQAVCSEWVHLNRFYLMLSNKIHVLALTWIQFWCKIFHHLSSSSYKWTQNNLESCIWMWMPILAFPAL